MWLCVYPTDMTKIESSGTRKNVVLNSQTFRIRIGLYRTHRSPAYGLFPGKYLPRNRGKNKLTGHKTQSSTRFQLLLQLIGLLYTPIIALIS